MQQAVTAIEKELIALASVLPEWSDMTLERAGAVLFTRQPELMECFMVRANELLHEKIDRELDDRRPQRH
jgi:hypothetical protein